MLVPNEVLDLFDRRPHDGLLCLSKGAVVRLLHCRRFTETWFLTKFRPKIGLTNLLEKNAEPVLKDGERLIPIASDIRGNLPVEAGRAEDQPPRQRLPELALHCARS